MNQMYAIEELVKIDVELDSISNNIGLNWYVRNRIGEIRKCLNNLRKEMVTTNGNNEPPVIVSLDKIVKTVVGCIYEIAPNYNPRNIETIMTAFTKKLKEHEDIEYVCPSIGVFYYLRGNRTEVMRIIHDVLFDILEFRQLNLSDREYLMGVDVDSKDRKNVINFVTRNGDPLEGTDDNFIDLDAVIQNIDVTLFGPYCEVKTNEHS